MEKSRNLLLGFAITALLALIGGCSSSDNPPPDTNPDDEIVVYPQDEDTDADMESQEPVDECSVADLNQWVDTNMRDYYYFYDQVPTVNLDSFDSPEELIEALRYEPSDIYSYVTDKRESSDFFEEGRYFGPGYSAAFHEDGTVRIEFVYHDSAAGRAGLKRGDILRSINDIEWADLSREEFSAIVGDEENPLTFTLQVEDGTSGEAFDLALTNGDVIINSVLYSSIISNSNSGTTIGYLAFNTFIANSTEELNGVMDYFIENNIDVLILDLRYNRGGRSSVSYRLASQIAGSSVIGQTLINRVFNDKYSDQNHTVEFPEDSRLLDIQRVVVLQSDETASASELVINGLKPYMDVVSIGDTTTGKSFTSFGREKCDKVMSAIEAERVNADGVSVFGGIAADCPAQDDLTRDFGLNIGDDGVNPEGMLFAAVNYIYSGSCAAVSAGTRTKTRTNTTPSIGKLVLPGGDIEMR